MRPTRPSINARSPQQTNFGSNRLVTPSRSARTSRCVEVIAEVETFTSSQDTILSIAWKFARMNGLPGHIVAKQLALQEIDPYEGIPATTGHVAVTLLARTLAIPRQVLKDGLHQPDSRRRVHNLVRFCTPCMKLAAHGVMHQRAGTIRCPCHHVALEVHCCGCGESMNLPAHGRVARCAVQLRQMPPTVRGLGRQSAAATSLTGTPARHHENALLRVSERRRF